MRKLNFRWLRKFDFRWLRRKTPKTLEERNRLIAEKATEAEVRAELLEKQAGLRDRLLAARLRQEKAKSKMSVWKPGTFKWVLIAVAACLILFAMFERC